MKRAQEENQNTEEWWSEYSEKPHAEVENQPIPEVMFVLRGLAAGKERVLDVGCWRGGYFKCFDKETEVHGVDLCQEALDLAAQERPDAKLLCADISGKLPYPDDHFDVVYFGEILEHLDKPRALCREVLRVLKPGGYAVANTPFEDSIPCDVHVWYIYREDFKDLFDGYEKRPLLYRFSCGGDWEHFLVVARKPC